jgi:purine-nucleoside phosphorylase
MQGRFHSYEGYSLALCSLPVKIFKLIGCKMIMITNAAGALNKSYNVGDLMVIKDHFSMPILSMQHPLIGPNDERFGPRFMPTNKIYDKQLRTLFIEQGKLLNIKIHEGVYSAISGPSYESVVTF